MLSLATSSHTSAPVLALPERVLELMDIKNSQCNCKLIKVNLIHYEVALLEQVQFEPGTATIKQESFELLHQLIIAKHCIEKTCKEFGGK